MIEDLGRFNKTVKEYIQSLFLARDEEGRKKILDISDANKVPCIIVAYWCGEVSGYPDYLKKSVDSLMKFYDYKEIKGKSEGCPW